MAQRVIFHIDVNSAFLSWTAAYRVNVLGQSLDLRTVPSVIAGERASRHGVILAKSIPAKKYGIQTGEPLFQAQQKCPDLIVAPPDYALYTEASRQFIALLRTVSPVVEQYSIDEAWVDMTGTGSLYGSPVAAAQMLRQRIYDKFGFTVNIGVSSNKLLAKLAGDFEKPNRVHTLFPSEIPDKMWPLSVRDLFAVGAATEKKLNMLGIYTIGDLAKSDPALIRRKLHKPGLALWNAANGRASETVKPVADENKSYGNSVTTAQNVTSSEMAYQILLALCETVAMRMRQDGKSGSCVTVNLRSGQFEDWSHQSKMTCSTDVTQELYHVACCVFDEAWDKRTPLRQLGVQVSQLSDQRYRQYDFFSDVSAEQYERKARLDATVDSIRDKYGENAILRARFVGGEMNHMAGGLSKERRTGVTKPV